MFIWIKEKINGFRIHLIQLGDDQPLNKAALVILIFLDIFILVSVFDGLDEHTRQLTSPDEYVTYPCREIVIQRNWDKTNRLDNLNDIISSSNAELTLVDEKNKKQHPICTPLVALIDKIEKDKDMSRLFENRKSFQKEVRELEARIKDRKGGYDTSLLESIAKHENDKTDVSAIKQDVQQLTATLNTLRGQIDSLDEKLNQTDTVKALWQNIQSLTENDREQLRSDIRTMNYWFPVKRLGMELLFLLPLFVVIYGWNSVCIRKARHVQTLVSSHLLVVVCIPIFFKVIEAIYDIIPKKLLKMIMDLLISFNLVAIWYYLVIALSVSAALFVIYILQKKFFSHEKLLEKRIAKGLCQNCGRQLPHGSQACPLCGFLQYKPCVQCNKLMHVFARYCKECGKLQAQRI